MHEVGVLYKVIFYTFINRTLTVTLMPETLREEVVLKRIRKYFKRIHNCNSLLPVYSPDERGIFRIIGGVCENSSRYEIERSIVKGRFVEVVGYAVRLPYFYPTGAPQDPGDSKSGYVAKVELVEFEESKSLDVIVEEFE